MADATAVKCPDCEAPAGQPCRTSYDQPHADRQRLADLRALEQGVCALCGRWMVRGSVEGSPIDAWHPDPADAAACPPLPDPAVDWNAYATATNLGLTAGHPGVEQFVSADVIEEAAAIIIDVPAGALMLDIPPTPSEAALTLDWAICPECVQGKHQNCTHETLNGRDEFVVCACEKGAHR